MIDRIPITRSEQLDELDVTEMVAGYWDGYDGEPEPRNNRSYSFWHGWRNGAVDGGHREKDAAQIALAHDVVRKGAL